MVVVGNEVGFMLSSVILLTAGSSFLMWLGEQIDEFGLGNGVSLIIQINILSRLPSAIQEIARQFGKGHLHRLRGAAPTDREIQPIQPTNEHACGECAESEHSQKENNRFFEGCQRAGRGF